MRGNHIVLPEMPSPKRTQPRAMNHTALAQYELAKSLSRYATAALLCVATCSLPASAVVVLSDGFGDADLDNDGTIDGNVQGSVEDTTWIPGRLFVDGMSSEPENTEVTAALDASDTGIRWLQMRGWTSAQGNFPGSGSPKPGVAVVSDSAQIETQAGTGGLNRPSLGGYAMSWESRGGGSALAGFFDRNIALGENVGDQVKVSFDFRLWGDTPNAEEVMPAASEIRFGLYQDTDDQLGLENPFAGRQVDANGDPLPDTTNLLTPNDFSDSFRPAVWGQDGGLFEGRLSDAGINDSANGDRDDIGARGDNGYFAAAWIGASFTDPQQANGGGARVREEVNEGRILQGGDVETIAQPENLETDPFSPPSFDYVNMETEKSYNLALTLERATDVEEGDSILTTLTITDLATMESFPLSGLDTTPESDSWDYFALRNATSGANEIDFMIDNFKLEVIGDDLPGDYNSDGTVDAADYTVWRDGLGTTFVQADYDTWADNYGATAGGSSPAGVPEPSAALLALVAVGLTRPIARRVG